jgi:hypothetical protein
MTAVGTRVFAVASANATTVALYGFGTYVGDHPRPGSDTISDDDMTMYRQVIIDGDNNPLDVRGFADAAVAAGTMTRAEADAQLAAGADRQAAERARPLDDRVRDLHARARLNPRIDLDNGTTVWGYQCWWGPLDAYDSWRSGRDVITVDVPH